MKTHILVGHEGVATKFLALQVAIKDCHLMKTTYHNTYTSQF
jgi:hypothetical protein